MDTPPLTRQQSRELDRRAEDDYGISGLVLMENAGRGAVDVLERLGIDGPVVILCGKGNNAGDGFVAARHLAIRGHDCRVMLLCPANELRGDAATNFAILQKSDVPIVDLSRGDDSERAGSRAPTRSVGRSPDALRGALGRHGAGAAWLVDAMLGTGVEGEPRPPFDAAIDWMNARDAKTQVMAVDVPSGLDCDTGRPAAHTVRADHTCTFAAMKVGFTKPEAAAYTGQVHVCDIGTPPGLLRDVSSI
jgi:NAD(P)H-hydrate epimerase